MTVRIQREPFDAGAEIDRLRLGKSGIGTGAVAGAGVGAAVGAIASFIGIVRDLSEGDAVAAMTLEHYPGMTEKALAAIVAQAQARWDLLDALVIHRVGTLRPTEPIVLVAVSSAHRGDAFAACEFIMDYLKTEAPFWKKEATGSGERWVDARESDTTARERWDSEGKRSDT